MPSAENEQAGPLEPRACAQIASATTSERFQLRPTDRCSAESPCPSLGGSPTLRWPSRALAPSPGRHSLAEAPAAPT
eukprot:5329613-Pleurochrysis_carterae.AAC.1